MSLEGKRIGFGFTGSHCTYHLVFPELQKLMDQKAIVIPIVSNTVRTTDTKFGEAADHINTIETITKRKVISTMQEAEPLGPREPLDCMVIAPMTGNSISKFSNAMTDKPIIYS